MSAVKKRRRSDGPVVLDTAARSRRLRKTLARLEEDNSPNTHNPFAVGGVGDAPPPVVLFTDAGASEDKETKGRKRKRKRMSAASHRHRRTVDSLVLEAKLGEKPGPTYLTAAAPAPKDPPRHFCAVCGFACAYACSVCGARYCGIKCLAQHLETRCHKWVS